jgi:hypothetical protein
VGLLLLLEVPQHFEGLTRLSVGSGSYFVWMIYVNMCSSIWTRLGYSAQVAGTGFEEDLESFTDVMDKKLGV